MSAKGGLVQLTTATTAFEAEWLVGALKGMGVRAVTFGGMLADEFAMSQKLLGLSGGVRVMVPVEELERAKEALQEIQRARKP